MAIVNSAIMNTGVHVSLSILVSSVCMPSSGIAGLYGNYLFFLKNESGCNSSETPAEFSAPKNKDSVT